MKRLFVALLFVSLSGYSSFAQTQPQAGAPTTPAPEHPATPEQVREYFKVVRLDQSLHALVDQMMKTSQATAPPYLPASLWDDLKKTFSDYDFVADIIPIYQRYLSSDDMQGILAFYRTGPGQKLVTVQPLMSADTQAKFRGTGQRLGQEVFNRHADEIKAAKEKYEQQNTPAPDSSSKPK